MLWEFELKPSIPSAHATATHTRFNSTVHSKKSSRSWVSRYSAALRSRRSASGQCVRSVLVKWLVKSSVKITVAQHNRCYDCPHIYDDARPAGRYLHPHRWLVHGQVQVWLRPTIPTTIVIFVFKRNVTNSEGENFPNSATFPIKYFDNET